MECFTVLEEQSFYILSASLMTRLLHRSSLSRIRTSSKLSGSHHSPPVLLEAFGDGAAGLTHVERGTGNLCCSNTVKHSIGSLQF